MGKEGSRCACEREREVERRESECFFWSHERREREEGWRPGQSSALLSHLPRRPQAEDDEDGAIVDEGDDRGRRIDEPVQAVA